MSSEQSTVPENFHEGIRDDGTIEGYVIETHYQPLERVELRAGYVAVVSDAGGVDAETRIPLGFLRELMRGADEKQRAARPAGCVCPAGTERTCQGLACPRRPMAIVPRFP